MAKGLAEVAAKPSLDMAMAGLAAASVGFVLFAMPDPLFADLVTGSGLPALLPAAEPPLGTTARLASVALAAAGTFLLVWLALRALNQPATVPKAAALKATPEPEAPASGRRRSFIVGDPEPEAPRIRRADAHPDAPARRPLFAESDLGEPLDEIDVAEPEQPWVDDFGAEESDEPLPAFMSDAAPPAAEAEAEEAPVFGEYGWEAVEDDAPGAQEEVEPSPAALEAEPAAFDPMTYQPHAFAAPEETGEQPTAAEAPYDPPAAFEASDEADEQGQPQSFEAPAAAAMPPRDLGEASISELMQRLERGLQRRGEAGWEAPDVEVPSAPHFEAPQSSDAIETEPEEPAPSSDPAAIDDRLRSALDDLQKMASRGAQG